jgi:alpha-ketoglutaric semialdehyde dehydrogenase
MELHGRSIIGTESASGGEKTFRAFNPAIGQPIDRPFYEATEDDIKRAFALAVEAFDIYRQKSAAEIAAFLERIGEEINALGEELIETASAETGLPLKRLSSERIRTVNQLRMFAGVVREGTWVEATIDHSLPEQKPLPRPDLRRMLIPLGPVVVFGASNFPLAFSVTGGDTASALAAGNPVIVKAHPAHPGTSEMVARAIAKAAEETGMPAGVFSLLQGTSHELSLNLVRHPAAAAVGFTGSLKAGRALFDAAAGRPAPIPVYAEMGSTNPVFVLPGALRERALAFAEGLQQSVTVGTGQFCTSPGLVVGLESDGMGQFVDKLGKLIEQTPAATMLHPGILNSYRDGLHRLEEAAGAQLQRSSLAADENRTEAQAAVLITSSETFLGHEELGEEVFGPSTVVVRCDFREDLIKVARGLHGHLTATIHGTAEDLAEFKDLIDILQTKVGRLVFNGFPTGVEVSSAMQHGGPYPATTDSRSTSVGTAAIKRFARPICLQNFPQEALPVELQDGNPRGIWRTIDGQMTKE